MSKIITKEEKMQIVKEYNNCCTTKEREDIAKKYGYSNLKVLFSTITNFKKDIGIKAEKYNKYGYNTVEEKLEIVKKWDNSTREEREELAKAHNATYTKFKSTVTAYRGYLKINSKNIWRSDEEKIKILEEYNKTKSKEEKEELAKKYNMSLNSLRYATTKYRSQLNIKEASVKKYTDEEKLAMIRQWDYSRTGFVERYGYKSNKIASSAISIFRKQLQEKGLI